MLLYKDPSLNGRLPAGCADPSLLKTRKTFVSPSRECKARQGKARQGKASVGHARAGRATGHADQSLVCLGGGTRRRPFEQTQTRTAGAYMNSGGTSAATSGRVALSGYQRVACCSPCVVATLERGVGAPSARCYGWPIGWCARAYTAVWVYYHLAAHSLHYAVIESTFVLLGCSVLVVDIDRPCLATAVHYAHIAIHLVCPGSTQYPYL